MLRLTMRPSATSKGARGAVLSAKAWPLMQRRFGGATCVHEAAHTVLRFALGRHCGPTIVKTRFELGADGGLYAQTCGTSFSWLPPDAPLPEIELPRARAPAAQIFMADPLCCWRLFLDETIIACAGHAAARKHRILHDLQIVARSADDVADC